MFIDQQIKRGQGVQGLGLISTFTATILASTAPCGPACWVPVLLIDVVASLFAVFKIWSQRGELRVAASAKAENYVESVWGTLSPNSPPEQDSVSKLIETCQLDAAQEMIVFLARQMAEKAEKDEYFKKWALEWGALTLKQIQSKLDAYRGYCLVENPPEEPGQPPAPEPVSCPSNFHLQNGICQPISCPAGFYLNGYGVCTPLSPPTLPPAIEPTTGAYIPLPQATVGRYGILGLMVVTLAAIFFSNR